MRFIGILLLVISLGEMVAAGVYNHESTRRGERLEMAADALEHVQTQQLAGDAVPAGALEQRSDEFDEAAQRAIDAEALAVTLLNAAIGTGVCGVLALLLDRLLRARKRDPTAADS